MSLEWPLSFLSMQTEPGPYEAEARAPALRALVVDPSLFTLPYDQALVEGLIAGGVEARLLGRPARDGERLPTVPFRAAFYRFFDMAPKRMGVFGAALKAFEHCVDGIRLALSKRSEGTVFHLQWLPFPLVDRLLIAALKWRAPVVVTVHDTMPFNGTPTSKVQSYGFLGALKQADRIIVHTQTGKARLMEAGLAQNRISVIPHGPLGMTVPARPHRKNERWTIVAFGKMRPYKGIDVLVEALGQIDPETRAQMNVIVAGEPMMDIAPLKAQIARLGLGDCVELREGFLDDDALSDLLAEADTFVFPYKEIEASGVLYLVEGLERWIIASRLGAFADAIEDGTSGRLVPPEDPTALAEALAECVRDRSAPKARVCVMSWDQIAGRTIDLYQAALADRVGAHSKAQRAVPQIQDSK